MNTTLMSLNHYKLLRKMMLLSERNLKSLQKKLNLTLKNVKIQENLHILCKNSQKRFMISLICSLVESKVFTTNN